jgi:hypothetical protein
MSSDTNSIKMEIFCHNIGIKINEQVHLLVLNDFIVALSL